MKEEINKIKSAFPSYLSNDIERLFKTRNWDIAWINDSQPFTVTVNNELLQIPNRVNLIEESLVNATEEDSILYCYLTRHSDGFIREKYLRKIIRLNNEWVIPYVMKLLGEHISEILEVIYDELENLDPEMYRNFIKNNISFYNLTKGRMAAYYGRYYRSYIPREKSRSRKNYVGFKILKYINRHFLI